MGGIPGGLAVIENGFKTTPCDFETTCGRMSCRSMFVLSTSGTVESGSKHCTVGDEWTLSEKANDRVGVGGNELDEERSRGSLRAFVCVASETEARLSKGTGGTKGTAGRVIERGCFCASS